MIGIILQAAMTKRETAVLDRPTPPRPLPAPVASINAPKSYSMKRKAEDNVNGVETEENGVRLKVFVMGLLLKEVKNDKNWSLLNAGYSHV